MRNTKKKGFTIVELVVVVAVIAILAAVLIPTFSGIIKKAKLNADEQTVTNMNKYVAAAAAEEEFAYPADAVNALYDNGFNIGKFETFSKGYHYAYDFEDNKFYLLDDKAQAVFPDKDQAASELWGFFNNAKSDKIVDGEGNIAVTKYIALSAIGDKNLFNAYDCVFAGEVTAYTLDLNGKSISVAANGTNKNITLRNGTVVANVADGYTLGTGAEKKVAATPADVIALAAVEGTVTVDGLIFNSYTGDALRVKSFAADATDVVFKNCVFDLSGKNAPIYFGEDADDITSYTFENCTFSLDAQIARFYGNTNAPDLTIKNCTISSGRGLNIGEDAPNASIFGEILIEGNTFIDNGTASGKPSIQFPACNDTADDFKYTAEKITIKDNEFICKDVAIRIHETVKKMLCNNVVISGNIVPENVTFIGGDEGTAESEAIAADWLSKVQ